MDSAFRALVMTLIFGFCVSKLLVAQAPIDVETGKLQGVMEQGVIAYKGIPYAAPPVESLRWRPPQSAAKWSGIKVASQFGNDCMQVKAGAAKYRGKFDEDCLVLNVWTPAKSVGRKLPVMVWIYGGGFVTGGISADIYDGSSFARDEVILVTLNYRLGRFGFFAHPALTHESPTGPLGNYGYMDQIAGLQWVHRNIAAFGGDPGNVTLFGESAGGFSVHALMGSALTHGLFARVILESGGGRKGLSGIRLHEASGEKPSAEAVGVAFANSVGIEGEDEATLAKLRALSPAAILGGMSPSAQEAKMTFTGPIVDGQVVAREPEDIYLAGQQPRIPVIVGSNSEEVGVTLLRPAIAPDLDGVYKTFGGEAGAAQKAFNPEQSTDLQKISNRVQSDSMMVEPARFVSRTLSMAGQPVWEYRFSYVADTMRKKWTGAPHNTELWYVFETLPARYPSVSAEDQKMASTVHQYWVRFAKTGNPNGPELPEWPRFQVEREVLMNFTNNGPLVQADPLKVRLDLVEGKQ